MPNVSVAEGFIAAKGRTARVKTSISDAEPISVPGTQARRNAAEIEGYGKALDDVQSAERNDGVINAKGAVIKAEPGCDSREPRDLGDSPRIEAGAHG